MPDDKLIDKVCRLVPHFVTPDPTPPTPAQVRAAVLEALSEMLYEVAAVLEQLEEETGHVPPTMPADEADARHAELARLSMAKGFTQRAARVLEGEQMTIAIDDETERPSCPLCSVRLEPLKAGEDCASCGRRGPREVKGGA